MGIVCTDSTEECRRASEDDDLFHASLHWLYFHQLPKRSGYLLGSQQPIVFHKDKGLRSVINNNSREKKGVFTIHADGTRDNAPKGKRHTLRDARRAKRAMRKELEEAIEGKVDHDSDSKE